MGQVREINRFMKKMGSSDSLNEDGKGLLKDGMVLVEVDEEAETLMVSAPVVEAPTQNLLPFFRRLLALNHVETREASFSLDNNTDIVHLRIKRPLDKLDFEEFESAVNTVAEVAEEHNKSLSEEFNAKSSSLNNFLGAVNPLTSKGGAKPGRSWKHLGAICYVAGFVIGIGAGIFTYTQTKSWALLIFVYMLTIYFIGRGVPSIITDDKKVRRFIYFALFPAVSTGVLFLTHWWFHIWWLNVLIAIVLGWIVPPVLAMIFMRDIFEEESEEDMAKFNKWKEVQRSLVESK